MPKESSPSNAPDDSKILASKTCGPLRKANSPAWQVLSGGRWHFLPREEESPDWVCICRGDLAAGFVAAQWTLYALMHLRSGYETYLEYARGGESQRFMFHQLLWSMMFFCRSTSNQVVSGDWESIASLRLELASVHESPVRIGRVWAGSLAEAAVRLQQEAIDNIDSCRGSHIFDLAMKEYPEEKISDGSDCWKFATTICEVAIGRRPSQDSQEYVGPAWMKIYQTLSESSSFRDAVKAFRVEPFSQFCNLELRSFADHRFERPFIGLTQEFAKAARCRIRDGLPIESGTQDKRPAPSLEFPPRDPRNRDTCIYNWMVQRKSLKWIMARANRNQKWERLENVQSVSAAARRYAMKHNLRWPIQR